MKQHKSNMGIWAKPALSKHIILKHRLPAAMREPAVHSSHMGPAWRWKFSTTSDATSGSAGQRHLGAPCLDWIPNLLWSVRLTPSQTHVLPFPREEHLGMQQCSKQELKQVSPASDLEMIQCWHVPNAGRLMPKNSWQLTLSNYFTIPPSLLNTHYDLFLPDCSALGFCKDSSSTSF